MTESIFDTAYFDKIKSDLRSESKNIRKKCLDELHTVLHSMVCKFESVERSDVFKTVIKVFVDQSEACREQAVNLTIICLNSWSLPEDEIMFYLLPNIHKRLVSGAETEPAEEVRLCMVKLMNVIVDKHGVSLGPHLKDVVEVLVRCICDEYPEVKKESCECASNLAEKVPEFRLHSEDIIKAILRILKHKHSKIRISAINSLRNIVQFGHSGAIELVYGALGESLIEQNPQIRLSVLRVATFWFAKLRDRYSYFSHLLPLVLTELTDDLVENRQEAEKSWHEIGMQYLRENEDTLKEKEEMLPKELEHYPANAQRPNLGCRTLVQNEMMKIIPTLMHELQDWQAEVRIKSSELLKIIILHGENRIVSFLDVALPVMSKACMDEELAVCRNVTESAELMGYFVTPDMYWNLLIPKIKENHSSGQFVVLAALLKYNSKKDLINRVKEIIPDLADDEIRETREERCQKSLLDIVSKLLVCVESCNLDDDSVYELYLILMSIMAFGKDETRKMTTDLMKKLAEISSNSNVSELNKRCLPRLSARLSTSCSVWESYSMDFNIFLTSLSVYSNDVLKYVESDILDLLNVVLNTETDREVVFKTLQHIGKVLENDEFDFANNVETLAKIILGPLKPQLIWRAGKVLEVMRCTAVSIVLLYVQKVPILDQDFVHNVFPLMLSLCEDGYDDTRIYSLQILPFIGRSANGTIGADIFVKSFRVATERLNDKSNSVRLNAAKSAKDLLLRAPDLGAYENESKVDIFKGLRMLLLNADEEDQRIRDAILDIMKHESITANIKSVVPENDLQNLLRKYRNSDVSDSLKKSLKI